MFTDLEVAFLLAIGAAIAAFGPSLARWALA